MNKRIIENIIYKDKVKRRSVKKMGSFNILLLVLAAIAVGIVVSMTVPGATDLRARWWLVIAVILAIKPVYAMFSK